MSQYTERVAAGLCGKCGRPREDADKSLCRHHTELERQRMEKRRERSKAQGLCSSCGVRPRVAGKARCTVCLAGSAASRRRAAARRKRDGLCPNCGEPALPGKVVCKACSHKMSAVTSKRYHEWRAAGKCGYCGGAVVPGKTMCKRHLEQTAETRETLKREVMEAYGGVRCSHCPEDDIRFLEIDHIDGGGNKHVKEIGGGGHALYQWLKRNNFPVGFRVLCRTCNNKAHVDRCRATGKRLTHPYE